MESPNPYRAPSAALAIAAAAVDEGESVPAAVVSDLIAARGAMRLFGVIGIVATVALLGLGAASTMLAKTLSMPGFLTLAYVVGALFLLVPATLIFRTANATSAIERVPTLRRLEDVMIHMAGFWRICGMIIGVGLFLTVIVDVFAQAFLRSV